MKKSVTVFLFWIIMSIYIYPVYANTAPAKVIYQVDENYPPFTYTKQEYLYGFDLDLTNLIFNSQAYEVNYSADEWGKVYKRLVDGEVDLAGLIGINEKRQQEVLFTQPVFKTYVSIYSRANYKSIVLNDLKDLRVGVGKDYYTETILRDELYIDDYVAYTNIRNALWDLRLGRIDVIFENQQYMDHILIAEGVKGSIIAQVTHLFPIDYAYAISKERPELVQYMNDRIEQLKVAGVFEELYMKYFYTHSDEYLKRNQMRIFSWITMCTLVGMIIFGGMRTYIIHLKKKLQMNYINLKATNEKLMEAHEELQVQYEEIQAQYEEIEEHYEEIGIKQQELEKSEERYRLVVEGANDGLWDWNGVTDTLYLSKRWSELFGFESTYIKNYYRMWAKSIYEEDRKKTISLFKKALKSEDSKFEAEYRIKLADQNYIWVLTRGKILRDEQGRIIRMAGSHTDISERKNYEKNIYKMAYYDSLTGLPNRSCLIEKLKEVQEELLQKGNKAAVYCIELDNFKQINDTLGHTFGDMLIKLTGEKLKGVINSKSFTARIGGDEFIILVEDLKSQEEVKVLAEKVMELFCKNWRVEEQEIFVSASIGVTIMPDDGVDIQDILKNADTAMYAAKEEGKGKYKLFNEEMLDKVQTRTDMEKSMRKAIENKEFELYYQPYFHAVESELVGLEALIRWFHPLKGMVSPAQFIPVAEETGLIKEIGKWVIEKACRQNREWQAKGLMELPIAVNVSGLQLESSDFEKNVSMILEDTKINPKYLKIEITESSIMKSIDRNIEVLNKLKAMGITISLDDFGTGYSSLSYMQKLPVDTIKIDKSFVDEIHKTQEKSLIIGDIISIAHKMNMDVIAEGVETKEQLEYLKNKNCDKIQGFFFSKPLPGHEIEKLMIKKTSK